MNSPLQITLRDAPRSDALATRIREQAARLERLFADIVSCRVSIKGHGGTIGAFTVQIDLQVPGEEIVTVGVNADAHLAVREAFGHAARQLQKYAQRLRSYKHSLTSAV